MSDPRSVTGFISGDRHLEHAELLDRSLRAATAFDAAGVGPGDAVAIMLRNDLPFIEASYGAATLGALAVPINWHYKGEEVAFILGDCGAKVLVVDADLLPQISGAVPDGVAVLVVDTPLEIAAAYGIEAMVAPQDCDSWEATLSTATPWSKPALPAPPSMIYTSGTTGTPKGVRRTSPLDPSDPSTMAVLDCCGIEPGMRTIVCGPMYHSAPNVFALSAGKTGGLVVLQPKFDPEELLALTDRYACTALHLVPTMMIRLLRLPDDVRARYDTSSLTRIAHAAAPCPQEIKRACIDWFGPVVTEYYGATESGVVVGCDSAEWLAHPGTVGKPLPGCEVRIYGEDGSPLGPGKPGEIFMWSSAYGDFTYEGRDAERAEIGRDHLVTGGDVGYLDDDGFLYLCDRRKDMIISGGVNIYPAEIEAALIAHPDVHDCAVFGIPDAEFGESVAAIIELADGSDGDAGAISEYLRERLAGFKVPRHLQFATDLPREDSGKIFKRKLRAQYWPEGTAI